MARHHTIVSIVALMGVLSLAPAAANASGPLLSGYGGPGAGEQAILGSQLLHGSSASRSASRPSAVAIKTTTTEAQKSQVVQEPQTARVKAEESSGASAVSTPGQQSTPQAAASPQHSSERVPAQSEKSQPTTPSKAVPARESSAQGAPSEPVAVSRTSYDTRLGLSGGDLLLLILVFGGLVAIAIVTRRLTRVQS